MTSTRITPVGFGFTAAGLALLAKFAVSEPAFAVNEFPPNAVVSAARPARSARRLASCPWACSVSASCCCVSLAGPADI